MALVSGSCPRAPDSPSPRSQDYDCRAVHWYMRHGFSSPCRALRASEEADGRAFALRVQLLFAQRAPGPLDAQQPRAPPDGPLPAEAHARRSGPKRECACKRGREKEREKDSGAADQIGGLQLIQQLQLGGVAPRARACAFKLRRSGGGPGQACRRSWSPTLRLAEAAARHARLPAVHHQRADLLLRSAGRDCVFRACVHERARGRRTSLSARSATKCSSSISGRSSRWKRSASERLSVSDSFQLRARTPMRAACVVVTTAQLRTAQARPPRCRRAVSPAGAG